MAGSSGSPVFTDLWEVYALHKKGSSGEGLLENYGTLMKLVLNALDKEPLISTRHSAAWISIADQILQRTKSVTVG
jgi:hypothetical protein